MSAILHPNWPKDLQPRISGAAHNAPASATVADEIARAVAQLEGSIQFFQSRYIETLIIRTIETTLQRAVSPLCDRNGAAALAMCDVSQIDRAAKAGIIQAHYRGGTPLFEKADILEAITSGRWAGK